MNVETAFRTAPVGCASSATAAAVHALAFIRFSGNLRPESPTRMEFVDDRYLARQDLIHA